VLNVQLIEVVFVCTLNWSHDYMKPSVIKRRNHQWCQFLLWWLFASLILIADGAIARLSATKLCTWNGVCGA